MMRQYRRWLKKRRVFSVLVVLIFVFGVLCVGVWANDQRTRASQEGANIGRTIQGGLGSSSGINQRLLQPLLTPTPMVPLGGDTSKAFNATILCPSSKEFLKISISPSSTGDLTLYISYDKGFTGKLNTSLVVSGVSAICSNGFMMCNPGTMSNCVSYAFYLDGNTLRYRQVVGSTGSGLSGCFCVNNACGGSSILATNLGYVLRAVGGMVVSAFLNDPSARSYVVSDSKIEGMSITFYGQDSSQCQFADRGSSAVQNLKDYYRNPGSLRSAGNVRLESQRGDPKSPASLVYSASQMSSGNVKVCVIKRVASGCSVVERTEGDCEVASCKLMEESWDGVPIIQGGVRTKLNPLGSCVKDECGNLRCYEWTTKRTVYVCPQEKIFNPAPRFETVYRSTTWDRSTGMVYYSDLTLESNCKSECPAGYVYSFISLKCEASSFCPSGYRFEPSANACVAEDLNTCQSGGTTQEICNNCPSGYVYDSNQRICVANITCPSGGRLVYDGGKLRCEADLQGMPNCPSGSSYDARLNICYTSVSCSLGSFDSSIGQCVAALSCPSGSSYDAASKLCEAEKICPEGTAYDDETKKCKGEPSCSGGAVFDASIARCASCPSGYSYDNATYACVSSNGTKVVPTYSLPCPVGTTYNSNTGLCEGDPSCPTGLNFDSNMNMCIAAPSCPAGFSFDNNVRACVAAPNCPAGFTLDASRGICVASAGFCPEGTVYNSNTNLCESSVSCPSSTILDSNRGVCIFNDVCPEGSSLDSSRGLCVANPTCPVGYKFSKGFCVKSGVFASYGLPPTCPSGTWYNLDTQLCEAKPLCPSGFIFDSNQGFCVALTSCPSGTSYNSNIGLCEASPSCPEGSSLDSSRGLCVANPTCPVGYSFSSASNLCYREVIIFFLYITPTCPSGTSYIRSDALCEAPPFCPSGTWYDINSNLCIGTFFSSNFSNVSCPDGTSFNLSTKTCEALPSCPSGTNFDSRRGLCVASASSPCPSGYVYDGNVGKCVFAISCPGGGYWDNVLGKCVKESFCVSQVVNACKITPSCSGGGVWDPKLGKCVIETTCSRGEKWVSSGRKSFYLGSGPEGADCEFACKVKVVEPKSDVYLRNSSTAYDLQYGTKAEKTGVSVSVSYYYKPCVEVATNTWSCPVEQGEEMVDNCKCVNNFGQAASIMQAIRMAGQDFVCSSGKRY
jgi:hypothetical protein